MEQFVARLRNPLVRWLLRGMLALGLAFFSLGTGFWLFLAQHGSKTPSPETGQIFRFVTHGDVRFVRGAELFYVNGAIAWGFFAFLASAAAERVIFGAQRVSSAQQWFVDALFVVFAVAAIVLTVLAIGGSWPIRLSP